MSLKIIYLLQNNFLIYNFNNKKHFMKKEFKKKYKKKHINLKVQNKFF